MLKILRVYKKHKSTSTYTQSLTPKSLIHLTGTCIQTPDHAKQEKKEKNVKWGAASPGQVVNGSGITISFTKNEKKKLNLFFSLLIIRKNISIFLKFFFYIEI